MFFLAFFFVFCPAEMKNAEIIHSLLFYVNLPPSFHIILTLDNKNKC